MKRKLTSRPVAFLAVAMAAAACGGTELTVPTTTSPASSPSGQASTLPPPPSPSSAVAAPTPPPDDLDLEFADLEIVFPVADMGARPPSACDDLDEDAFGDILGEDVYVRNEERLPAIAPARSCQVYGDVDDRIRLHIDVTNVPEVDRYLSPFMGVDGYTDGDGLGDRVGYQPAAPLPAEGEMDVQTAFAGLKVEVGSATLFIAGKTPGTGPEANSSGDISLDPDTMALALQQATIDLWSGEPGPGSGQHHSCADLAIEDLASEALGEFVAYPFAGNLACVAQTATGDRLMVRTGQWRRAARFLDGLREDYEEFASWGDVQQVPDLAPELDDAFAVDDRRSGSILAADSPVTDEIFAVDGTQFINISVEGQAAIDDALSPADLHELLVDVLYGPSRGPIRFYEEAHWMPVGGCGVELVDGGAELVDCAEPHDLEVYAELEPDGPFVDLYETDVDDPCYPEFAAVNGTPIVDSALVGQIEAPNATDWERGFRTVRCIIYFPEPASAPLSEIDLSNGYAGAIPWSLVTPQTCVADLSDIGEAGVVPSDCSADGVDVLALVEPADGDVDAQCDALAAAAGYTADSAITRESYTLSRRGFTASICVALLD